MLQIVEMSYEEKILMYDKCSKEELIKMLIESNKHLERLTSKKVIEYPNGRIYDLNLFKKNIDKLEKN